MVRHTEPTVSNETAPVVVLVVNHHFGRRNAFSASQTDRFDSGFGCTQRMQFYESLGSIVELQKNIRI